MGLHAAARRGILGRPGWWRGGLRPARALGRLEEPRAHRPHRCSAPAPVRKGPAVRARELSLRSSLAAVTVVIAMLALLVSGALVGLTSALHQTTSNAASSAENVRLAQEAEIDLLLHDRAGDALVRRDLEERIVGRLAGARGFVTSAEEARAIAEAESKVAAYLGAARDPEADRAEVLGHQEAAYGALETLVAVNLAQARNAQASAAAWDRGANAVGIAVGALLLAGAAGVLVWLRRRAFAPVFALARAMERFGRGDREARAPERGPAELREMSRRFNEMAAALAAQRQSQMVFLGGVAHDLRNPLSVLKMSVELVGPGRPLPPEARLRELIERIARQITRLDRMASDFLDMARIEAGELELKPAVHDARELVAAVVELFRGTSPEPRLLVSVPDEAVELYGDAVRLEQVLTNLVSNAIKYSPAGSAVEVAVEPEGDDVVLRVSDHGLGIPEAERERVFEPFRRAGLEGGAVPGVGLGLFVVRRIVDAHGGQIAVESAPGAGSTFRIRLPRSRVRGGFEGPRAEPRQLH